MGVYLAELVPFIVVEAFEIVAEESRGPVKVGVVLAAPSFGTGGQNEDGGAKASFGDCKKGKLGLWPNH